MTDFLWRWWWLVLMAAYIAAICTVCHIARAWDSIWWWRHDQARTMRREMKK